MTDFIPAEDPAAAFLEQNSGDYAPSFKFERIGDAVGGTIKRIDVKPGTDLKGHPQTNMIVEVLNRDGQEWAIWIPSSKPRMVNAVKQALAEHGLAAPQIGDAIAVTFSGETPPSKPGYSPGKVFSATYKRAATSAAAPAAPAQQAAPSASDLI